MKYIYKINSSYDGFTPPQISERINNGFLTYNWKQYFEDLQKGDIIFTYFIGHNVQKGIYLISRVFKIKRNKQVKCRVLLYDQEKPLIPPFKFKKYEKRIILNRRGSVYVIPSSLDTIFERLYKKIAVCDLKIRNRIKCVQCFERNTFKCESCQVFDPNILIKWDNEVSLKIPQIREIVAPFWIIPRQQHWMKKAFSEHPISDVFYSFKSGYQLYSRIFAFGILKAIKNHSKLSKTHYDYIIGVPLSPNKRRSGELDRVAELCKIVSKEMGVKYLKNSLSLSKSISRRLYKLSGIEQRKFIQNYYLNLAPF